MEFHRLEVTNWKCFANKKVFNFKDDLEVISWPNGHGKTSMFEAIMYAIWGDTPTGFNLNTVRNDDSADCRIFLSFSTKDKDMEVERIFGSKKLYELRVNGEVVAESVRTIKEYMEQIIPYSIAKILWTRSLISSDILSVDYFSKSILTDVLSDANNLLAYYKSENYHNNREIRELESQITTIKDDNGEELNIQNVEERIAELTNILQNGDKDENSDTEIKLAHKVEGYYQEIDKINTQLESIHSDLDYEKAVIQSNIRKSPNGKRFSSAQEQIDAISNAIEKEDSKEKFTSETIKGIRPDVASNLKEVESYIHKFNDDQDSCAVCGNNLHTKKSQAYVNRIEDINNKSFFNENNYNALKELIANLAYTGDKGTQDKAIELNIDINNIKSMVRKINLSRDYKEIIKNENNIINDRWKELESLQKNLVTLKLQEQAQESIRNLQDKIDTCADKISVINDYVKKANVYFTNQVIERASKYMNQINQRYQQIGIISNAFNVAVTDSDFNMNIENVIQLSSGEKTIFALSMLFAVHDLMAPELPLLFDETFSALDQENLSEIQKFLLNQNSQIFIITHDLSWQNRIEK
jgi:DNA repair exonuclease SbcCD ATPase subunit